MHREMREVTCQRFEGRVVVVTGGASGIGAACVRRFAAEGARVVVADLDEERGAAIVAEVPDELAVFARSDVANQDDWQVLRRLVLDRFGRLDVLHSNAFVQVSAAAHELDARDWDRILDVNLKAAYLGTKVLVDLLEQAGGAIVLTSSVNAHVGR